MPRTVSSLLSRAQAEPENDSCLLASCRAASTLKLGDAEAAKIDCSRVLERVPNSAKALFRRAQAELALKVRALPTHQASAKFVTMRSEYPHSVVLAVQ